MYPNRTGNIADVIDIALVKGLACPVQVFSMTELSSDHCPITVHVATQHPVARDVRPVVDWNRFGSVFEMRLPEAIPLDSAQLIDEAVDKFDETVTPSIQLCTRMTPNLTRDYHRIPEEVRLLALQKNRLRRRWQRTRDRADKSTFNRAAGKLRRDMQAFRNSCWEFTVAGMADSAASDGSVYRLPSALTGKRRRSRLPAIAGPFGQALTKPEEKSEYLGVCLKRQFAPNPPNDWDFEEDVSDEIEEFLSLPPTTQPELTSVEEVTSV